MLLFSAAIMFAYPALPEEPEPKTLEPLVVTPTKTPTPLSQTGSSVTVIDQVEIEQKQAADVIQILREQPGFSLIQTGSRGGTTSIFTRGGNSNMNLILIDGMKVNQGGGAFDFSDLSTSGIGRVEIVRGPQSALYGADALTSVIQLFTPRGQGPFSLWAGAGAGNYDTNEQRTGFSWGNKLAGVFFEFDRIETSGILNINNDFRNYTAALRLDFAPLNDLDFTITGRHNQSRFEFPTEGAGDRFQAVLDPRQFNENERFVGTLGARYRQTMWLEHHLKGGVNLYYNNFEDPNDVPPDFPGPDSRTKSDEHRYLVDYHAVLSAPAVFQVVPLLTVGASYERQTFFQRSFPVTRPDTSVDRENHAGYGQLQLGWLGRVFLTGGVRYDSSTAFGQKVNPRVSAAVILPVTQTRLRGAWGTGIKEPSFFDEFGGFGIPGNPNIKAEKSESWEVGMDQPLFERLLEVGVTYFHNNFEDLIAGVPPTFVSRNIREAQSEGVELVLVMRPVKGWSARANYTYLETEVIDNGGVLTAEFVKGQPLLRRPRHSGGLSVAYEHDRFTATATLFVKGDSVDIQFDPATFTTSRVKLQGYEKLDLSLAYVLIRNVAGLKEIIWKTRMQNVLDQKYEEGFGFSTARFSFLTGFEARY
ncbi:MAG TPA: TonB-dependent receptor [Methylomirabilota bacterium]|nr:TonB-dependent receptor [Methylomirabilota bacterium]